jgi:hypothetical protein
MEKAVTKAINDNEKLYSRGLIKKETYEHIKSVLNNIIKTNL